MVSTIEYGYCAYEDVERVRALGKEQRDYLLKKYSACDWFIDASEEKECDECFNAPFGTMFPLTGDPMLDKNALDVPLCKECFLAFYAKDELKELIK